MDHSQLPPDLQGRTQAVTDIAPGPLRALGPESTDGVRPPKSGVYKHTDPKTGQVTTVESHTAAINRRMYEFRDRPA